MVRKKNKIRFVSDATDRRIEHVFDKLYKKKELIRDAWKEVERVSDVLDENVVCKFKDFILEIEIAELEFQESLRAALWGVRSDDPYSDERAIISQLNVFEKKSCFDSQSFLNQWKTKVQQKIDAYHYLRQLGVPFLQKSDSLQRAIDENSNDDLYVLFSRSDDQSAQQRSLFLSYKKRKAPEARYVMVDLDLHRLKQSPMVSFYSNGKVKYRNCATDDHRFACLVRPIDPQEEYFDSDLDNEFSPPLRVRCPRALLRASTEELDSASHKGETTLECSNKEVIWRCFLCHKEVTVGIGKRRYRYNYIFCDCGGVRIDKCGFKCDDPAHGDKFVQFGKNREAIIRSFVDNASQVQS